MRKQEFMFRILKTTKWSRL